MMDFPSPRLVFRMFGKERRGVSDRLDEEIHADGKIGAPHESGVTFGELFADSG